MMRFYKPQPTHQFYCGIDLHARTLYLCVLDQAGKKVLHKEVPSEPAALLGAPSVQRTGTSSRSEPDPLISRREERTSFWDAVFCNRSPSRRDGEDRSRRSGNGSRIEPVKMFGAVRGSPRHATAAASVEIALAIVRTVKLSTRFILAEKF